MSTEPRDRVRITSPRATARRPAPRPVREEIDAQTAVGELYVRSLMRSQLRLAIGVLGTIVLCLGSLPLLFFVLPQLRDLHVLGIPLNWLVLGFLVYPFLLLLGWFFVRQTERTEREFADLVDHP